MINCQTWQLLYVLNYGDFLLIESLRHMYIIIIIIEW